MENTQALTTIIESNHIDLAIACWLDAHSRSLTAPRAEATGVLSGASTLPSVLNE